MSTTEVQNEGDPTYFRFAVVLLLAVAISVVGVAIEKLTLACRRDVSRQRYRLDALREQHARVKLRTQQLSAPGRLLESVESGRLPVERTPPTDRATANDRAEPAGRSARR